MVRRNRSSESRRLRLGREPGGRFRGRESCPIQACPETGGTQDCCATPCEQPQRVLDGANQLLIRVCVRLCVRQAPNGY